MMFASWQPAEERIRQTIRSCRAERLAVIQYHLGMLKQVKLAGEFFAAPLESLLRRSIRFSMIADLTKSSLPQPHRDLSKVPPFHWAGFGGPDR